MDVWRGGKRENSECLGREKVRENGKRERGGEMGVGRGMCKWWMEQGRWNGIVRETATPQPW